MNLDFTFSLDDQNKGDNQLMWGRETEMRNQEEEEDKENSTFNLFFFFFLGDSIYNPNIKEF